jgi:hypothetical protein
MAANRRLSYDIDFKAEGSLILPAQYNRHTLGP